MKRTSLLFFSFLFGGITPLFSQAILTRACNGFRSGDRIVKQQVEYEEPGDSGTGIFWNFSNLKPVNDHYEVKYRSYNDSLMIAREHRTLYKYVMQGNSLMCSEARTTTELHAQSIAFKSVAFRAEQNLKKQLRTTKFERSDIKSYSVAYSDRKIDELLTEYFRENAYIMRRSFEQVCYCTKWMAVKRLTELAAEGK